MQIDFAKQAKSWLIVERVWRSGITLSFILIAFLPLFFAIDRLEMVTGMTFIEAMFEFPNHPMSEGVIAFTFLEALVSSVVTIALGLPIAWQLGRYEWKYARSIRALLAVPFVTPAIVAAMGFLAMIGNDGALYNLGIDLRLQTGIIGEIAELTGWENPGHFIALMIAHAWFNLSLVIRFVEPKLATLSPDYEEQLSMLGQGKRRIDRIRHLWIPLLMGPVIAAAGFTFVFSFTSFALVKWLTPFSLNIETLMASVGGAAGIIGYRLDVSQLVLGAAMIQFFILLLALWLTIKGQNLFKFESEVSDEGFARKRRGKASPLGKTLVYSGIIFTLLPLLSTFIASIRIRSRLAIDDYATEWSFAAYEAAWQGDYSATGAGEAMLTSIYYALITMAVALPIGWTIASNILKFEREGKKWTARALEILTILPLAISSVVVGLGILLGILRWSPELFQFWMMPVIPHIMLTTPFVIRIMLPRLRENRVEYKEQAQMLGLSPLRTWWHAHISLLRGPLIVAAAMTLAFSLGEFGASWVLVRIGSWDTLSVLVDSLMSRPKYDPMVQPIAMAAASMLMLLTFILFLIAERFRPKGEGGGF